MPGKTQTLRRKILKDVAAAAAAPLAAIVIAGGTFAAFVQDRVLAEPLFRSRQNARVVTDALVGLTPAGERRIKELVKSKQGIEIGEHQIYGIYVEISQRDGQTFWEVRGILIPWMPTPKERPSHELLGEIASLIKGELIGIAGRPGKYRLDFKGNLFAWDPSESIERLTPEDVAVRM